MANADNPFAALLAKSKAGIDKQLIEDIFLFTLKKDQSSSSLSRAKACNDAGAKAVLCLADVIVSDSGIDTEMGEELLAHVIFERLMLSDPKDYLVPGDNEEDALKMDAIVYLHRAYVVCEKARSSLPQSLEDCEKIRSLIITNSSTCMRQPDLYPGRAIWEQWKEIMEKSEDIDTTETINFVAECVKKVYDDEDPMEALGALKANFYPLLGKLQTDISHSNMITMKKKVFWILNFFVNDKRIPQMGEVLIDYTMPNPNTKGE